MLTSTPACIQTNHSAIFYQEHGHIALRSVGAGHAKQPKPIMRIWGAEPPAGSRAECLVRAGGFSPPKQKVFQPLHYGQIYPMLLNTWDAVDIPT